jgi:ribokinase
MASGRGIVVVGSYMRDLVMRVDAFPQPGETRIGHGFFATHGGKGSNQAVQAARCGADITMIGSIGDDPNGHAALALWAGEGIGHAHVAVRPGIATGVAMILVDAAGENQIVIDPGANMRLAPADVEAAEAAIAGAALVVAQLETPVASVHRAFEIARAAGVTTLLNTAPAPAAPIDGLIALADILVANEGEAASLAGQPPAARLDREAGRCMASAIGVRVLVITAGADGAWLFARGTDVVHRPAPAVGAIADTTGAGDAFIGAFAARLVESHDLGAAMGWGVAAGSLACTKPGAVPSLAGADDVRRLAGG